MTYKVEGITSDGERFFVDGSANGKTFYSLDDAIAYAEGYAHCVGTVGLSPVDGALLRATKEDGYFEDITVREEGR